MRVDLSPIALSFVFAFNPTRKQLTFFILSLQLLIGSAQVNLMGTTTSSTSRQNPNCLTEGRRLVQEWCRFIPICLEQICTVSYFRFSPQQNQRELENPFDQPASSSASNVPCDIFINHRRPDVKHTLATTIYQTLSRMGLRVFLDVEALHPGDVIPAEIRQAMATASLHIAIFSKTYVESPWCLNELSFMLETHTKIIPIFYYVQPSDLRYIDKGIYADAFDQLKKKRRYPTEKLEEWKKALHDISFHSGLVVNNNGDEGRLLKNIVNCVLRVMKKVPSEVADHPVGMDELVQKFEEATLQSFHTHHNAKIIGIVGMGGSGKTTLSKELYNKKFSSFDKCSFVSDVRDAANKNALHDKQKQLLNDLGFNHLSVEVVDVEVGRGILTNCLRSLRVLIVIDDVDHKNQLHSLLPDINSLASSSFVIVTTREKGVLISPNVSSIYEMPKLNKLHAERLFCWHAFLQPFPPCEFEILVKEFVNVCSGLPLSLKVFGGQLYGQKSKQYWESTLDKISRIVPTDIKQRLKISYDALDKEEKEIFLDVACFLIGEEKSLAIAVWDGCGWNGLHSWETLVNKCLVELDHNHHIKMHDQLRDMGREIATDHTPHRFWTSQQILDIPTHHQGRTEIRGIADSAHCARMEIEMKIMENSGRVFKYLTSTFGLKIVFVREHEFGEEVASLSEHLVWLRWYSFQDWNLPPWLSLRNLRVLELYHGGDLEELWEDNVEPPLQLIELRITGTLRKFPSSIGRLKHLKKIICTKGFGGSSLPEEFCGLESLEHLELPSSAIVSLPARLGELISLRHIDLSYAQQLSMLPDSFKKLVNLEYLNLECCENLSFRLDMLENITKLEFLNLRACVKLEELPHQITNQASLRELNLENCFNLRDVPVNIGTLCKLETLRIGSWLLTSLPNSLGNLSSLNTLDVNGCRMLTSLPNSLGNLSSLNTLHVDRCCMLTSLPCSLVNLSSLTKLYINWCEKLERLPHSMERLNLLRELSIENSGVRELSFDAVSSSTISNLKELKRDAQVSEISVCHVCCPAPQTPSPVADAHLMQIELWQCKMLKNIRGGAGLLNLQRLSIPCCPELDELPSFADLASLKEFRILGCPKVEKIEGLENCRALEILTAWTCWKVPGIQSLRNLESLKILLLRCDSITAVKPCIQSMKVCPCDILISGRVVRFVKPIVSTSFEFLHVTNVESSEWSNFIEAELRSQSKGPFLLYGEDDKVVEIFLSQHGSRSRLLLLNAYSRSMKGMLMRGEGVRLVEAFYQILACLE